MRRIEAIEVMRVIGVCEPDGRRHPHPSVTYFSEHTQAAFEALDENCVFASCWFSSRVTAWSLDCMVT